ncbi:hypothetical protein NLI96_g5078 [Meripilus lineatus]|uniref:F-box domain-containing protein n=1 Tax=Meripilus lineatus TaxID=2056292 RepID=A0AAD5V8B5_9APHY|nr:hypothetical protein NLI96_g5078 [Physisporinus lineatus]
MDSHHLRQSLENILQVIEILNQSLIRDVTICIDGEYYSSLADHLEASHCEEMETLLFSMPTIRSLTFLGDIAAWGFDLHTAEDLILEIEEGITPQSWIPGRFIDRFGTLAHLEPKLESLLITKIELPIEVGGMILSNLGLDKASLAACALVSKTWSQESRPYLFRTLIIKTGDTLQRLETFAQFLALTHNLGDLIETLVIVGIKMWEHYVLPFSLLASILQHLHYLRFLSICHFTLKFDNAEPTSYIDISSSTLQTLRIGGPFHYIISRPLLGLFPSLKELHLEGPAALCFNEVDVVDPAPLATPFRSFRLETLSILGYTNKWARRSVDDLAAAGCLGNLRTLNLRVDDSFTLLNFRGVFRTISKSLKELSLCMKFGSGIVFCSSNLSGSYLSICPKGDANIPWEAMNLHLCTSLQTLKFSIDAIPFLWSHQLRRIFEDILRVIKTLDQSPIRDVVICVAGEYPLYLKRDIEESHWEKMQTILLSMPTIRSLTFYGDISEWDPALLTEEDLIPGSAWVPLPEVVEDEFASHLPYLVEEGIFKHASRGEWRRK